MLLDLNETMTYLCCPVSKEKLTQIDENKLVSTSGTEYQIVNGRPILVDFESSVLSYVKADNSQMESVIPRSNYSGLKGRIKKIISPTSTKTRENLAEIYAQLKQKQGSRRVLVIGGGAIGKGMEDFYNDSEIEVVAFDIYASENVQFIADAHQIPLHSDSFDVCIIQAVLEHVLEPKTVVLELVRVLCQNGIVYAETPFLQQVHEGAYDFTRYTESGHRNLFKDFTTLSSGVIAGAGTQLLWSLDFFFRSLFRSKTVGKLVKLGFFWLAYLDRYIPEKYAIDSACAVYFIGQLSNSAVHPKEIIAHYKGAQ